MYIQYRYQSLLWTFPQTDSHSCECAQEALAQVMTLQQIDFQVEAPDAQSQHYTPTSDSDIFYF